MTTNPLAERHLRTARYYASWLLFFTLCLIGCIFAFIIAYQNQSGIGVAGAMLSGILTASLAIRAEENSRHHKHLYELACKRQHRL